MNKYLFLLALFCLSQAVAGQSLQWVAYGHGPEQSISYRVASDNIGNTIIGGYFSGNLSFAIYSLSNATNSGFITKYDAAGTPLWAKQISGTGNTFCIDVATDSMGNVYAAGYFDAPITIDSISLPLTGIYSYFIAKYSPDGNVLWAVSAGNIFDVYSGLTVDNAGNAYFSGCFYDTLTIGNYVFETQNYDVRGFMVKYNPDGNLMWAKQITGTNNSYGRKIYTNGKSVFWEGLVSNGTHQIGSSSLTTPWDGVNFLCKFDSTGDAQWIKTMGNSIGGGISSMITDENENLYFTGSSFLGFFIDTVQLNGYPGDFAYVAKLNPAGQVQWLTVPNEQIPGQSNPYDGESSGNGISLDNTGRVIVAGYFDSDFRLPGFTTLSTQYYNNLFVLALDSATGTPLAAFQDGGAVGEVAAFGMALHPDGSVMVTGAFGPGISLQAGPTVMSQGSSDVFLAKYSSLVTAASEPVQAGSLAVTVHPNPATGTVQVTGKCKTGGKTLFTLRDITGRTVSQTQANPVSGSFSQQIDVSELNTGIYLLQVQTGELSQTLRLVKQ